MNSMKDCVFALDNFIHRQLGYPCRQFELELFTDGVGGIFLQRMDTMTKPFFHSIDGDLHGLIDARNYIVYGKARRVSNQNDSDTSSS
jgi:hypothetical protein